MSISDIFDALTASDRPYKRAVPVDKALDILGYEVRDKHLDGEPGEDFFRSARVGARHRNGPPFTAALTASVRERDVADFLFELLLVLIVQPCRRP